MYSIWYYSMVRLCCFCSPDQHPTYTSVIRPHPALLLSCTFTAPFHALVKQTDRTVEHFMYVLWAQLVWTCQTHWSPEFVSAGLSLTPPDCKSCTKVLYCWLKSSYQCSVLIHFTSFSFLLPTAKKQEFLIETVKNLTDIRRLPPNKVQQNSNRSQLKWNVSSSAVSREENIYNVQGVKKQRVMAGLL